MRLPLAYRPAFYLFALIMSSSACLPLNRGELMESEIEELKTTQLAMAENYEAQERALRDMITSSREDVEQLKSVLKEARELLQRNNADLGAELQTNREELRRLRGMLEELDFGVSKLAQDLSLFKEDIDIRFASGEALLAQLPDEAAPLFEFGEAKLEEGKMRAARKAFEKFLDQHADHPRAPEAQFNVGETYRVEGHWVTAIGEYQKTMQSERAAALLDDATFRIGEGFYALGRCENARVFFETVVQDYGSSEWASSARVKLNELDSGRCGR